MYNVICLCRTAMRPIRKALAPRLGGLTLALNPSPSALPQLAKRLNSRSLQTAVIIDTWGRLNPRAGFGHETYRTPIDLLTHHDVYLKIRGVHRYLAD